MLASRLRHLLPLLVALMLVGPLRSALVAQAPALQEATRLFEARDYRAARDQFAAVAAAEPDNAPAAYYLGRLAIVDGHAEEAVRWLERAAKIDPSAAAHHHWLGRAYSRQVQRVGRFKQLSLAKKIRREFETAVRLAPDDVEARRDLMQFHLIAPGIAGGDRKEARRQAREIAARNPVLGRVASGWMAEQAKKPDDAVREYQAAIAQFPDSSVPYFALGMLYQRQQRWDQAFATYERLLAVRPDEIEGHYQIGRTAAQAGTRLDRGVTALKLYLSQRPREGDAPLASAHFRLGVIYERQGQPQLARAEYQAAVRLDPGQPDARAALRRLG